MSKNNIGHRNAGDWNTGDHNTGDWNTGWWNAGNWNAGSGNIGNFNVGNFNTGDRNAGCWNAGNWNAGDWNTGDHNTGCFCAGTPTFDFFNKPSAWTWEDWRNSVARIILDRVPEERDKRQEWWDSLEDRDKVRVRALPNFDSDIFEKCTGIRVDKEENE